MFMESNNVFQTMCNQMVILHDLVITIYSVTMKSNTWFENVNNQQEIEHVQEMQMYCMLRNHNTIFEHRDNQQQIWSWMSCHHRQIHTIQIQSRSKVKPWAIGHPVCSSLKFISVASHLNLLLFVFWIYFYLVYSHFSLFRNFEIFSSEPP